MASQNVSRLLGTLDRDPDNEEALSGLADLAENGVRELTSEDRALLSAARNTHEQRGEHRPLAQLLEIEAHLTDGEPDRKADLLKELGRIYREELLDDAKARVAFERALQLRPGDDDITEAVERLDESQERWRDIAERFLEEVQSASDARLKCGLYVSAATLKWKHDPEGTAAEVDGLFREALDASPGDGRAVRLYAQVLRANERYSELAEVLLRASQQTRGREERVSFALGAARVLARNLEQKQLAADAYGRVLDFVPGQVEAMAFLVEHFTEQEDWDHLVALYEDQLRARKKLEDETGALLNLGMVHWRFRESPEDAEPHFARLRTLEPAHPGMLDYYRETLAPNDPSRWFGILTDAQRMSSKVAQRLELALELARAAQDAPGSQERAIDAWKAVLRLDATNPEAPEALKALYERSQKWNALVELLKHEVDAVEDDNPARKVALLGHLVPIYRDKLELDAMVIQTYNAILELDPANAEALDALAQTYEATGRWNDLIQVLTRQADAEEDTDAQVDLRVRIAGLWIERFANYNQATKPLEQVIEAQPDNGEALGRLEEIYRKKRAWPKLYQVLGTREELADDGEERATLRLERARLAGDRLHQHAEAITLWTSILEADPDNAEAVTALEKLAEREEDWPTLAQVLELRVAAEEDGPKRTRLLQRLGSIYADHLDEPHRAAGAWKRILEIDPKNGRALRTLRESFVKSEDWDGLEALYGDVADWEGLVDVLGNAAERASDPATKVELSFRAARVYADKLEQPHRAFRSYERILAVEPENADAARALIPLYERDEKWSRLPKLYEVLYRDLGDDGAPEERLAILEQLRSLAGGKLRDDEAAFEYAARAFALAPEAATVRDALEEAAGRVPRQERVVGLFVARLDAIQGDDSREEERLWLRRRVAELAHGQLGQTDQAVEQLKGILEAEPGDRAAAEVLEQIYRQSGKHRELRGHLLHRISHAADDVERAEHLRSLARLEEEVLDDPESAASRYRQLLELPDGEDDALSALDRLTGNAETWDEHAAILLRRYERSLQGDERRDLMLRLGKVRLDHLGDRQGALSAFSAVAETEPENEAAVAGLESLTQSGPLEIATEANRALEVAYLATEHWEKLIGVLQERLRTEEEAMERQALRLRIADLAGERVGDAEGAYHALEGAFLEEPGDVSLWDRLVDTADAAGAHEELAKAFSTALDGEALPDETRAELARRVAHLYDVELGDPGAAEPFHRRVIQQDPLDDDAFIALKELYTNSERWDDLQVLYRNRIAETVDQEAKLDLLTQLCFLFEELIDDPELAVDAYQAVLDLDPGHQSSRRALERLYERTERWRDLAALLRVELDQADDDEQVGLTQRLGVLHEKRLGDIPAAVDHYEQVLAIEPHHKFAREALERLLDDPSQRQRIARVLEPVYQERGDWQELTRSLEVQLEDINDPGSQVSLLTRIAELEESRLHDPSAAFRSMARAVEADPADRPVREELARLAGMRNAERERAAVLEKAIDRSASSPGLSAELLLELARLWDEQVRDVDEAERAYKRLIEVDLDDPDVVLEASRALERIHLGKGEHAALAEDLRRQIEYESDGEERARLLVRLAELLETTLGDPEGAIRAHRERLDLDPTDRDALRSLERLYQRRGEWQRLIGVLQNRDQVEDDPDEQRAIARQVGLIYEHHLNDPGNAIVAYNEVLGRFGTDRETLDALSRLYEQGEQWDDLLEVAEMVYGLADDPEERATIRFQMAELMRERTGDLERAVEAYREVLELVPDHGPTIEALGVVLRADGRAPEPEAASPAPEFDDDPTPVPGEPAEASEVAEGDEVAEVAEGDEGDEGDERAEEGPEASDAVAESTPQPLDYPLSVRIEAARVLMPHYEATASYPALLDALAVLGESDDPLERYRSLRRAAEVADVGLEDPSRAFTLLSQAVRLGLGEDDLHIMLADLARLAAASDRWADYVALLRDVAPDIGDADLQTETYLQMAMAARDRLADPDLSRRLFEKVLELAPDDHRALDALESLTHGASDHAALLDILRRKTELAESSGERVSLLLRRAELSEGALSDPSEAIDCYEQALTEAQPQEAYVGLERLYRQAERYDDLAMHYERMLDEGVGSKVELRYRLGATQLDHLDDPWSAIEQFREALTLESSHTQTIEALERMMEREDHRAAAAEILEPVFLQSMNWPKVTTCLEARFAAETDVDERKGLLHRLGQMHEDYLEDLDGAMEAYARLFAEDPRDETTWETLSRLARVLDTWERLAEIYEQGLADITVDDPQTARLAFVAGDLNDRLERLDKAAEHYARALAFEPSDRASFEALEQVYTRQESWAELLDLYERQAENAAIDTERVALLRKSARILEEKLAEKGRAIEVYRDILTVDAADPGAIDALDRLLTEEERWADLADHIRHQVELFAGEPEELDLRYRLAQILSQHLDDTYGAVDLYEEITSRDPNHAETVQALEGLVQDPDHQVRIIEILEPIYLATDQWRKRIAVYEARVKAADDPLDAVPLLGQIAELHETRGQDLALAFHGWSRALTKEPSNEEVRSQVDRLAESLDAWDAHVSAYEEALAQEEDPTVRSALLSSIAKVHDEKRGDPRAAIETYERLLTNDPDDEAPLDALEALHTMVGDWRGLVDILERKVERAYEPEARAELHDRAGSVLEELLTDPDAAVAAYRRALGEDPEDRVALEALDRLYLRGEDHAALAEILQRRIDLELDDDLRVELGVRLGGIYAGPLASPDQAIDAYQRVTEDRPEQTEAVAALAELYERQELWPELLDNLRARAERAEGAERVELMHRSGEVLERKLDDLHEALPVYEEIVGLAPTHGPTIDALIRISRQEDHREQAAEVLEPLLREQGRWDDLAELLESKAAASLDPVEKRVELRRLAEVHETGRNDPEAAFDAVRRALAEDPEDAATADELERLAVGIGAWDRAADVFASRASASTDPDVARALYGRLARIAEIELGDDARAIEAHARTLEAAGDDPDSLAALDRLYVKTEAWPDLGDILDRRIQAAFDPGERALLLVRLGQLRAQRFDDRQGALRAFRDVLDEDPTVEEAVVGMESLLVDDALAPEAIEVLDGVYRRTGNAARVAELFDARVRLAASDEERVDLLRDQTAHYEEALDAPGKALGTALAAFTLDPRDEGLLEEVERLAGLSGEWDQLRGRVEAVLERDDLDETLIRDLNLRAAGWYAGPIADASLAEARYRAALASDPTSPEAHTALVSLLRVPGRESDLVEALVGWADADYDEDAKKERLREAAQLAESAVGDQARARACYEALLEIDPGDPSALDELIRLEGAAGNHETVTGLLARRVDVESEPNLRLVLRKRLAKTWEAGLEDLEQATAAWRDALDEEPTDLESIGALERLYEQAERWTDLEELIQRRLDIADTPEERVAARVRLARLAEQRFGRRDDAIAQLREILAEQPGNAEALDELERLYRSGEDWDALVDLLETRVENAAAAGDVPTELDVLVRLGSVHLDRRQDPDQAAATYERVLQRDPSHLGVLGALVDLHREREDWGQAASALERQAEIQGSVDTLYELAEMSVARLGDPVRAEAALRRAYELEPTRAETRDRLKAHYEANGQPEHLAALLAQDLQETAEPAEQVALLRRISDLYAGPIGDPGTAAAYLEQAAELVPEDRDVLLPLCDLYVAAGRELDAVPVLERIIASYGSRRNKEVAVYHHRLGKAKESMGDYDGALASFDAAFKVDLTNVMVLRDLGRLCLARGDLDRAQKTFRALLLQKLRPEDGITKADVYFHLGDISGQQGDSRKAISMLERAKAENPEHPEALALLARLKG